MTYIIIFLMAMSGYYTLTYGLTVFHIEKNKVGGIAVVIFALAGIILPAALLIIRK